MSRLGRNLAPLAALALAVSAAPAWSQAPGALGSDRAGKAARVDRPPPDPTPAPGTPLGKDQTAPPVGTTRPLGNPVNPDVDPSINITNPDASTARPMPPVVGSRQIDRFDAIKKLQASINNNPKALADLIILGELAHEVAVDLPAEEAGKYFAMARDAWEKALALDPTNAGLRAAVQFARDQQAHMDEFERSRDEVTDTFLDARRRDLAATGNTPSIRVDGPPLPDRTLGPGAAAERSVAPRVAVPSGNTNLTVNRNVDTSVPTTTGGRANAPTKADRTNTATTADIPATTGPSLGTGTGSGTGGTNFAGGGGGVGGTGAGTATYGGPPLDYSAGAASRVVYGPAYRPFATPNGQPFTYQQYSSSYFPSGLYNNPAAPPVSLQRFAPGATRVVPNALERQILNRPAPATAPR